ncbi:MAG: glycoside hydrolase family 2 protein, partial [Chloroflexi bacterium]|nr:glycoside hydrolase family 2 protein [Chloroflexota bacterium]
DFDGAMLVSSVYLNGTLLGVHKGGFTPFSFEITDHLKPGENVLTVYVDATENEDIPPYGNLVDFLTFGGLYRDVYLRIVDPCHIENVFVSPTDVLTHPGLECGIQLAQWMPGLSLEGILKDAAGRIIARQIQDVDADKITIVWDELGPITLWTLDNPVLYQLALVLSQNGAPIDQDAVRFGFRSAKFRGDGSFLLNGKPLKLFGLNRHQTYPYIGAAAPARLQCLDAEILKYELGCNVVRTSHYGQSPHFLNRCDEIGLLVLEEIAGWQHIGDETWQELVLQDLQAMLIRDRNHPSIILWGVRINESPDHDNLYTQTNLLAHELDPTRQTGGVRNFIDSKFLEDVFTLNDFTEGIQLPRVRPHLITEFGGHTFPTKSWDHEERRVEHALIHARKHNLQMGDPDVAGAIGWCAFDYHTHKEFGSGDRICHHGVMDIYRLPKMAAFFYRSQKSPADEIVLYAATNWTMGDRSGGGNNPLIVFSNCDEIDVLIGGQSHGRFKPDDAQYPHLNHPPFVVRWPEPYNPWENEFCDLLVQGFINGQLIAEHKITADHLPDRLWLSTHTTQLQSDGADMARIAVQIVDRYGNVLPYQLRIVEFSLEGDAELIGENPLPIIGGQGACYIKSGHTEGMVVLKAQTADLPPVSMVLHINSLK